MIIYPAIDIRNGKCVRLVEGDYDRESVFDSDPADAAIRWVESGAEWLHVIDLDGARSGIPTNLDAIMRIRRTVNVPIQVGGGIRSAASADTLRSAGIDRIILGSLTIKEPDIFTAILERHGSAVAVALDARDGRLAAEGWLEQTELSLEQMAGDLRVAGVERFVVTDIKRDGTLTGADFQGIRRIVTQLQTGVIGSGGVGTLRDVEEMRTAGAEGLIIGRALYDGGINLADAISEGGREL